MVSTSRLLGLSAAMAFVAAACSIASSSGRSSEVSETFPAPEENAAVVSQKMQTAVFAGGCFWGIEAVFEHLHGVRDVKSGYSGGGGASASYEAVSNGDTDHAEAVKVTFDPAKISYQKLLEVFFTVAHDPTQLNRQGPDVGRQYRSAIFYASEEQNAAAQSVIASLTQANRYPKPIVTEIVPLKQFYDAESYHQDYMRKNPDQPYIVQHDKPKIEALKNKFPDLFVAKK
jgi:peptide-methionine (S)-S-oxide reductase